jgi:L-serine dehydratase
MGASEYPDLFNDVFGPVMQPGSSSHTAGPCRLGRLAADLLGEPVGRIRVLLDEHGSFSGTFGVMAEDRAMVAGALGMGPDDERLFRALELARDRGVEVGFELTTLAGSDHPNAVELILTGAGGRVRSLLGASTGGGMVETTLIDGFPLRFIGDGFLLLLFDPHQRLTGPDIDRLRAAVPGLVEAHDVRVDGRGRLVALHLAEAPVAASAELAAVRAAGVEDALLRPVLPVVRRPDRAPRLFDTMTSWRRLADERSLPLWEVALQYETGSAGWSREAVIEQMRSIAAVMDRQTRAAYERGVEVPVSPFKPDFTAPWARRQASPSRLTDPLTADTVRWAYGAGAGIPGVETVTGPMGSGGGYIDAALSAVRDHRGLDDDDLLHGLFVAGGVGLLAFMRTEPTGEVLGCTGEGGVCGAMAAAGIAAMAGATPQQVEDAASLALQAFTGMPCDPIPGGGCQPCRSRLLAATCMAHVFADVAMAGHAAVLPLDEAIDVADTVGRALPRELLCTAEGGACATPTGRSCRAAYQDWLADTAPEDRPPGNLI